MRARRASVPRASWLVVALRTVWNGEAVTDEITTCGCGHQKDEHTDGVCQERGCGCIAFVPVEES